jgi:hypothetical protein
MRSRCIRRDQERGGLFVCSRRIAFCVRGILQDASRFASTNRPAHCGCPDHRANDSRLLAESFPESQHYPQRATQENSWDDACRHSRDRSPAGEEGSRWERTKDRGVGLEKCPCTIRGQRKKVSRCGCCPESPRSGHAPSSQRNSTPGVVQAADRRLGRLIRRTAALNSRNSHSLSLLSNNSY